MTDRLPSWLSPHRVVLLALLALVVYTFGLAALDTADDGFGFRPVALAKSLLVVVAVSVAVTYVCAAVVRVPPNSDSWLITALILFFVMPVGVDGPTLKAAALGAFAASLSKYVLVWRQRLIVNPVVAGAVTCYAFTVAQVGGIVYLSWWVASAQLLIPMLVVGVVVVTVLREWPLLLVYVAAALGTAVIAALIHETGQSLSVIVRSTPLLFLGVFMLPEPLTSPSTRKARLFYGALVGALMYSSVHFAVTDTFMFAFDPEIALLVGCLFAFGVRLATSTARRVRMSVVTAPIAASTYAVTGDAQLSFRPGQWAKLSMPRWGWPLWRRSRRVFSFASQPGAPAEFAFTVNGNASPFKQALIDGAHRMWVDNVGGDFVLSPSKLRRDRVVLLSSGIGITPHVAMLRALLDESVALDRVVVVHVVRATDRAVYGDVLAAAREAGARVVSVVSTEAALGLSAQWFRGEVGALSDAATHYFVSGAPGFVSTTVRAVRQADPATVLRRWRVHTDTFTGY